MRWISFSDDILKPTSPISEKFPDKSSDNYIIALILHHSVLRKIRYYNFSKNNISHDNAEINEQLNTAISIWQELLKKYPNDSIYTFLIDCANGKTWDNPFDF